MISQEYQCSDSKTFIPNFPSKIRQSIKRMLKRYSEWQQMKEQHRQLLNLSDRMLKDIGLSRADVVRITTGYDFRTFMMEPDSGQKKKNNGKKED